MRGIILYLMAVLLLLVLSTYALVADIIIVHSNLQLPIICALSGAFGGMVYCLRGVYLNACVKKHWDRDWHVWYIIRPVVSSLAGGVSFIFLKAGLLVLDTTEGSSSIYGFLALAFISGLNVDKFVAKIEDVAKSTFGIEKSRANRESDNT